MPSGVGLSEFPRLERTPGVELEGSELDRVMVRGSLKGRDFKFKCGGKGADKGADKGPFVDQCPAEKARMTEPDRSFVTDQTRSDSQRAERLFENLRRVEVHLVKWEKLSGAVSKIDFVHEHDCPREAMDAALRHWGTRVMFRPDQPAVR